MHVVINQYSQKGGKTLAIVTLDADGKVKVQSEFDHVRRSLLEHSWNYKGMPVSAKDGKKFLEALPSIFSGSRVRAQLLDG
jgi:hypothetical protein